MRAHNLPREPQQQAPANPATICFNEFVILCQVDKSVLLLCNLSVLPLGVFCEKCV